jgi:septal ring-binding cell division protein DamX
MAEDTLFSHEAQSRLQEVVADSEVQSILSNILAQRQLLVRRVQQLTSESINDTLPSVAASRAQQLGAEVTEAEVRDWLDRAASGTLALS